MINITTALSHSKTKYGKTEKVKSFRYFVEIVQIKISEKKANTSRQEKIVAAFVTHILYIRKR